MPQNFKQWLEAEAQWSYREIASARGSSSGSHGYGEFSPERPAGDPWDAVSWEIEIKNPRSWDLLRGKAMYVVDGSGGSYHEKWVVVTVYAQLDPETEAALESNGESLDFIYEKSLQSTARKPVHRFVLEDPHDFAQEVRDAIDNPKTKLAVPQQSSEDYYKRLIDRQTLLKRAKPRGQGYSGD